jgi:hypothetical protein
MTTTYDWHIVHFNVCDLKDKPNSVVEVFWRKSASDEEGNTVYHDGETRFDPETIEKATLAFSDFSKLKEKSVLKWIQNNINDNQMTVIDELLNYKLSRAKYKIKVADLPWKKD